MDDIVIIGNDFLFVNQLTQDLMQDFLIKDLSKLDYFLHIEATKALATFFSHNQNIFKIYWLE